jgi:hypothetical protein
MSFATSFSVRRFATAALILLFLAAGSIALAAEPAAAADLPQPSAAELKTGLATVERIYEAKISAIKTPTERAELAREIFANRNAAATLAERYGIEATALQLATKGDDPALLLAICDELAKDFKLDRITLLIDRLGQSTGAVNPTTWPKCLEQLTALVAECTAGGRFDDAAKLATAVASLAKRARDPKAAALAASFKKSIAESRKVLEKLEKLEAEASGPDADPAALLELGRLLCFSRNEWEQGCRYLARAGDTVLSKAAGLELKAKTDEEKLTAADAWAKAADEAEPGDRRPIREHAAAMYTDLLPGLTGLAKVRVDNALEQVLKGLNASEKGGQQTQWTVIFRSAKPDVWNSESDDVMNFAIPLAKLPPLVRYVRLRRANGEAVILPIDRAAMGAETTTEPYGWNGTNVERFGAQMLGIADRRTNIEKTTGAVATSGRNGFFSGWGFGHRIHHGGEAELCWSGKWLPREPLEISVIGRPLTPAEERALLR